MLLFSLFALLNGSAGYTHTCPLSPPLSLTQRRVRRTGRLQGRCVQTLLFALPNGIPAQLTRGHTHTCPLSASLTYTQACERIRMIDVSQPSVAPCQVTPRCQKERESTANTKKRLNSINWLDLLSIITYHHYTYSIGRNRNEAGCFSPEF